MFSEALLDEQLALERDAVSSGADRLRQNVVKLEKQSYASASIYGVSCIRELIPHVSQLIEDEYLTNVRKGKNGTCFKEIHQYLNDVEPEVLATIAVKVLFDCIFSPREETSRLAHIANSIGQGIEAECQLRFYETDAPELLQSIKRNYWHSSAGTRQKLSVTRLMMTRKEVLWARWPTPVRTKLGAWLLDCILVCTDWFDKVHNSTGTKRVTSYLCPTAKFMNVRKSIMETAELFCPQLWPMLVPPKPWSETEKGGYLLNELTRTYGLIRNTRSDHDVLSGEAKTPVPLQFLNQLQQTAYRLNPATVSVAEVLFARREQLGKFIPEVQYDLPPKPHDIADNYDSRKSYRREAAAMMNLNAQMFRKSSRTRSQMELVARFKDRDRFYLPWSFDYRGRCYPIPAFLTPQDTDFGKSLLRFADEAPMTPEAEHWLAFQVATTWGLDKSTIKERIEWVLINQHIIRRVAIDPLGNKADWEIASEPWQFLAACEEYYACVIAKSRATTGLPVAVDATCSGLQILAGLGQDAATAALVNVAPGEKPQDAYLAVAESAKPRLEPKLAALLDRKVTKRTVMTIPYNAKPFSNRKYIRDALKEKEAEFTPEELTLITKAVIDAMRDVVPGPMRIMDWLNSEVAEKMKAGETEIRWVTPSGFHVRQYLMKPHIVSIQTKLLGRTTLNVYDGQTDQVDKSRHKAATAPNLIHSLDASLLHLSFRGFDHPFTVIHDSVLCRATDMAAINTAIRSTYAQMFSGESFLHSFARQINAVTEPPIIGDFDPRSTLTSTYFFC
jgi:DNA-directed RNA polymerase